MIRHYIRYALTLTATLILTAACSDDSPSGPKISKKPQQVSISSDDEHWTYYSLEESKLVGTSDFGDSIADKQWASRTDWDIAISGDLIRTNGGASGSAGGGIQEIEGDYDALAAPPTEGYLDDKYE